jgi:flagellar hook-associated protein 2
MATSIYGVQNYYNFYSNLYKSQSITQTDPMATVLKLSSLQTQHPDLYNTNTSSDTTSYLTSLSKNAYDLKTVTSSLMGNAYASSYTKKMVTTTDNTALTGLATSRAAIEDYTVNISKLAKSQVNTGTTMNSTDKNFELGVNTISVKTASSNAKSVSFNITDKDTNKTSLQKMASAINNSNVGVKANVVDDTKTGTSYLNIVSNKTGENNAFTIEDVKGNATALSGANTSTTSSQNAQYTVNGKQYTSQENNVYLNNDKVKLTLSKAEDKDIKVTIGNDTSAVFDDIKKFVSSYNNMINFSNDNLDTFNGASKLKSDYTNIIGIQKTPLNSMGITINSDKTLSIDEKKLDAAIKNNPTKVKDTFSGYNGIAEQIYKKSNEISISPSKYANNLFTNSENSSLSNYISETNYTAYFQSMSVGSIVNSLV